MREAKSLDELSADLQMDDQVGAVIVSEDIEPTAERVADMVREIDERKFDKVYRCTTPPDIWLVPRHHVIRHALQQRIIRCSMVFSPMKAAPVNSL